MTTLADDLDELARLKSDAEDVGRDKKNADAEFKTWQTHCLDRMEAERSKSHRSEDGVLFTRCEDRVKGQVEDRRKYVRWCLEQDEAVQEFLSLYAPEDDEEPFREEFYDLLVSGLELLAVKEKQDRCNAQARSHIADGAPLPPGLTFRPDPYIQQRRS